MKTPCNDDCPTSVKQNPLHICVGCGSCLYAVGFKQVPHGEYPLFECLGCGRVNFWD